MDQHKVGFVRFRAVAVSRKGSWWWWLRLFVIPFVVSSISPCGQQCTPPTRVNPKAAENLYLTVKWMYRKRIPIFHTERVLPPPPLPSKPLRLFVQCCVSHVPPRIILAA